MHKYEAILAGQPFFMGINLRYLRLICKSASDVAFDAGEFLFHQGEKADRFYLVRRGRVALEVFTPERGVITIETISDGGVLGASCFFPPYLWHFEAQAIERTHAMVFDTESLRRRFEDDPRLGFYLIERFAHIMTQRLKAMQMQLVDLYADPLSTIR